eukprot:gene6015-1074_t
MSQPRPAPYSVACKIMQSDAPGSQSPPTLSPGGEAAGLDDDASDNACIAQLHDAAGLYLTSLLYYGHPALNACPQAAINTLAGAPDKFCSPMLASCARGSDQCIQLLLQAGASPAAPVTCTAPPDTLFASLKTADIPPLADCDSAKLWLEKLGVADLFPTLHILRGSQLKVMSESALSAACPAAGADLYRILARPGGDRASAPEVPFTMKCLRCTRYDVLKPACISPLRDPQGSGICPCGLPPAMGMPLR